MKALMTIAAVVMMAGVQAKADGFVCTSESGLNIKVYNHTQPDLGTRTGAIMVVSDSSINAGNKTIATFKDVTGLLTSKELLYTGKVDLRFNDTARKGELIGGTKLGELSKIMLNVNFSYLHPVSYGEELSAHLYLVKRNGDVLDESVSCARYLKN